MFVLVRGDGETVDEPGGVMAVLDSNDPALVTEQLRRYFEAEEARERERIPRSEALKDGMCQFRWSRAEVGDDWWAVHAFCDLHPDEDDEGRWLDGPIVAMPVLSTPPNGSKGPSQPGRERQT